MTVRRQQALFAAEDWKIAYKAYSQIDFQAYDFDSIRSAMVEYIRTNFPENFNDYVESSEFIAIIEMLAYLSQSLAFRMDVNTRENFLETAESRESVFNLARMLGYNAKRNVPASGLMKITSVKTTEPIVDSLGNDLNNRTVFWNDANNSQSYEQFLLIINSAMSKTNRFTSPVKQGIVGNIRTELYQFNTPASSPITFNFGLKINGVNRNFNVVNPDFEDNSHFFERHPDPTNLFHMIYRNDGRGVDSIDTGFFVFVRQGTLEFVDFNYTTPLENRLQDIAVQNINENDVYLQEINSAGLVLNKWEKISNTIGQTLNYNSKQLNNRNLYAVENLGTDGVRLRFADGNFGNVPTGIFRLWHRVSDPSRYVIQPENARNLSVTVPYEDINGRPQNLTVTFSLQRAISNSLPAESVAAIKQRAPQVYYTQNRMVSAQDYNVFPESQSDNITKIKAINRTHAGHSRYIESNDPTGTFYNVDTFADDAYLYVEDSEISQNIVIDNTTTSTEVVSGVLPILLKELAVNNFVYQSMRDAWTQIDPDIFRFRIEDQVVWNPQPAASTSKTGFITETFSGGGEINVLTNQSILSNGQQFMETRFLKENAFLKFVDPENPTDYKWARVTEILNNGRLSAGLVTGRGPWTLSDEIPASWQLVDTIVTLRKLFSVTEAQAIEDAIRERKTFGIGYDISADAWYIIPGAQISASDRTGKFAITDSNARTGSSWLLLMEYVEQTITSENNYMYNLTMRGENYVVQSVDDLKFYNVKNIKVVDSTGRSSQDTITFSTVNTRPGDAETFEWIGSAWRNQQLLTVHPPRALRVDLPLKTRDTTWQDIETKWQSNFGIIKNKGSLQSTLTAPITMVTEATIPLNTYHPVGAFSSESNVVVANNIGRIQTLPSAINVNFTANTFGDTSVIGTYNGQQGILYKQYSLDSNSEEVFFAPANGNAAISLGSDPDPTTVNLTGNADPNNVGHITVSIDNEDGSGIFVYGGIQDQNLLDLQNGSRDKLIVEYVNNKQQLDQPIKWQIADVYREPDGYTDPRKVRVSAIDTDGDLVPDRPRQFTEFVDSNNLVLFETYQDIDGYSSDRPVRGVILDWRNENEIKVTSERITAGAAGISRPLAGIDWLLLKNRSLATQLEDRVRARGMVIYAEEEDTVYQLTPSSTQPDTDIKLVETEDYYVRRGRGATQNTENLDPQPGIIRWEHVAPSDVRIDPSISNIVEMVVLTSSYYDQVRRWQARPAGDFPLEPTSDQLGVEFRNLNQFKSASDVLVFRSAKFRLLFGSQSEPNYQARFRVVKLSDQFSDNELKTRIIATINEYFAVENWEFGETFYFTELSTYIHQRLGSAIGSIIILPKRSTGRLGEMFQVQSEPNELFINTATVNDIEIVSRLDNQTLRVDR